MTSLRLRPFTSQDEAAAVAAHTALARENFSFLLFYEPGESWPGYLNRLEANRRGEPIGPMAVPASLLAATVDGELVGRISIRYALDDFLARYAGHIGYAVLSEHRYRGYATEMLRQGLIIARAEGVGDVLVTCDDTNTGSARAIEACGGELESVIADPAPGDGFKRRYWIR